MRRLVWMVGPLFWVLCFWTLPLQGGSDGEGIVPPIDQRFAAEHVQEVPDFQRHMAPLMGRLGCNGRACHGSFQGRGGFRLSLFGYDFAFDHEALTGGKSPRVNLENPDLSKIIYKPTDEDEHEGGLRYERGSWQYHVFRRWIEGGARFDGQIKQLEQLQVIPAEIVFSNSGQKVQLKVVARWADGWVEDVTPLCRFQTNDELVAEVTEDGLVTAKQAGDSHIVISYDNAVVPIPVMQPVSPYAGAAYPDVPAPTMVDRLVVRKLRKLGIIPSELCSDAEFLRRVRLDMTGTLPTPEEVEQFLADPDPQKRERKVEELLQTPAYAAWWTTRLCDWTGNNDQQLNNVTPVRGRASAEWYEWIYRRVADNVPYDKLVEGIVTATSRQPGQDYLAYCQKMSQLYQSGSGQSYADLPSLTYYWARRDFRELEARAIGFAYSFMGIRIQCAQCHKHPFDQWSRDDFHQFKMLFSRVATTNRPPDPQGRRQYDQLVRQLGLKGKQGGDLRRMIPQLLKEGKTVPFPEVYVSDRPLRGRNNGNDYPQFDYARLLGGERVDIQGPTDPRQELMQWLRRKDNPYFAYAFVNRVWASYFHRGIVDPPDDLSRANPPSNRSLLDWLAQGFIDSGFDMKWVHRTIANSRTYQLSWKPNETNAQDQRNFSHAIPRRLPAEVLFDALQQATASDARIQAMQRSNEGRAIAQASPGYRNRNAPASYALTIFGRSTRESNCDCDRSSEPSLLQTVYLQNDRDVLQLLDRRDGWLAQLQGEQAPAAAANKKQIAALTRQIAQLRKRLSKRRQSGAKGTSLEIQQQRLRQLQRQLKQLQPAEKPKPEGASPQVDQLVRQAYLRTLSRPPQEGERARALQYLAQAEQPLDGMRDLLWALLNTKEFVVNH